MRRGAAGSTYPPTAFSSNAFSSAVQSAAFQQKTDLADPPRATPPGCSRGPCGSRARARDRREPRRVGERRHGRPGASTAPSCRRVRHDERGVERTRLGVAVEGEWRRGLHRLPVTELPCVRRRAEHDPVEAHPPVRVVRRCIRAEGGIKPARWRGREAAGSGAAAGPGAEEEAVGRAAEAARAGAVGAEEAAGAVARLR